MTTLTINGVPTEGNVVITTNVTPVPPDPGPGPDPTPPPTGAIEITLTGAAGEGATHGLQVGQMVIYRFNSGPNPTLPGNLGFIRPGPQSGCQAHRRGVLSDKAGDMVGLGVAYGSAVGASPGVSFAIKPGPVPDVGYPALNQNQWYYLNIVTDDDGGQPLALDFLRCDLRLA